MPLKPLLPASLHQRILRLAVVVIVVCAFSWQAAQADAMIHVVQPGENLFRIGLRYGVSWTAIMEANRLADTTIYVGQQLIIPGTNALPDAGALPAPTEVSVQPAPAENRRHPLPDCRQPRRKPGRTGRSE